MAGRATSRRGVPSAACVRAYADARAGWGGACAQEGEARGLGRRGVQRVQERRAGVAGLDKRVGESGRGEGGRREGEEKENGKRKGKMENEKKKGKREKRERERLAPALIAATTAGPVGHAQRSRARADEATEKDSGN